MDNANPNIIISKDQAIAEGYSYYFTGEKCQRGHICNRRVKDRGCVECVKLQASEWREKNKEKIRINAKKYREQNKEKVKKSVWEDYLRKREFEPWEIMISSARRRSRYEKIPFDLTYEWGKKKWTGICEISGIKFDLFPEDGRSIYSPSLDKIIPELGYVQTNCRFILWGINNFKGVDTDADIFYIAKCMVLNS